MGQFVPGLPVILSQFDDLGEYRLGFDILLIIHIGPCQVEQDFAVLGIHAHGLFVVLNRIAVVFLMQIDIPQVVPDCG